MSSFKINQVALQLYTLRNFCKTLPDFVTTIEKVKATGYQAVQVSGIGISYPEAKKALDDAGLIVCATHESSDLILEKPEEISERLNVIGTTQTAYPYPREVDFSSEDSVRNLVRRLDAAGAVFAKNGQTLSYHNHALEFVRFGKETALDFIFQETNPAHLKAELDTYWVQFGGGDPATWLEKMTERAPLLHIKDYIFTKENKASYGEIGHGNLDWKRILAAAEKAGTQWLIVEQDDCPGDPFVSIKKSYDYLNGLLAV